MNLGNPVADDVIGKICTNESEVYGRICGALDDEDDEDEPEGTGALKDGQTYENDEEQLLAVACEGGRLVPYERYVYVFGGVVMLNMPDTFSVNEGRGGAMVM